MDFVNSWRKKSKKSNFWRKKSNLNIPTDRFEVLIKEIKNDAGHILSSTTAWFVGFANQNEKNLARPILTC